MTSIANLMSADAGKSLMKINFDDLLMPQAGQHAGRTFIVACGHRPAQPAGVTPPG